MTHCTFNRLRDVLYILLGSMLVVGIMTAIAAEGPSDAKQISQAQTFSSAEEAVKALIDACKRGDTQELLSIFGPEGKEIVSSGDDVADKSNLAKFVKDYETKNRLEQETADSGVLYIGEEDWPFPVPIVKMGEKWIFDAAAGKEEILNRRIGRNELGVIEVMHAYVDAQREYSTRKDRGGNTSIEFAQKIRSDEGKRDGLYWPVKEGEEISPLGPFAAEAVKEGYKKKDDAPIPYHGYYYKILKAQGKNAPGGEYNYVADGKMILGFALVAWPADHGNSGIMTFIVNQDDIVYQKDLGADSEKIAAAIEKYDPDGTWKKAENEK
ncbi:conserved exported hypothetical protein [uncultured Desulfobacterium sp.]|uniref:DUF2950 domain-containing protein n=1 Tax=uncultured Desulfobacterium sp. TaxID=201089 RepID=A0A445N1M8_9BACT|nr:conserved exported hypothetical protein [uncultured Desulfobacterium sp.]